MQPENSARDQISTWKIHGQADLAPPGTWRCALMMAYLMGIGVCMWIVISATG